jgi:hypothetical protein
MTKKNGGAFAPPSSHPQISLLNRDDTLHVQREVRNTMIWILAGLDVAERDRD